MSEAIEPRPVRIEVGTSELEGGRCRAWADPALVVAAVAQSFTGDTFSRFVEPKLLGLDDAALGESAGGPELPLAVRGLLARLKVVHATLYRENRSLMREARWVDIACLAAEEDRVYLVKTSAACLCVLRDGQALPLEIAGDGQSARQSGVGSSEKLRLDVSSFPIEPGDVVVLLSSETERSPDLRAIARLFAQTSDLKRACDGLTNLLGLQSQSACVVALRFVPIGPASGEHHENALEGLAGSSFRDAAPPARNEQVRRAPEPALEADPDALVDAMFDDPHTALPAAPAAAISTPPPEPEEEPNWQLPWEPEAPAVASSPAPPPEETAPHHEEPIPVLAAVPAPVAMRAPHPLKKRLVPALLGLAGIALVGVVALPVREALLSGGNGAAPHGPGGQLWLEPSPPARRVLLDGQPVAEGTPARVENVPAGRHTVSLDLGICGSWETEVKITKRGSARIAPRLKGSIEITNADPSFPGRVWVQGGAKVSLPARLDSLPLGWNRIFYEDERVPLWDRQVLVRADQPAQVVVPNHHAGEEGFVTVESMRFTEGRGLQGAEGDSVYVDDAFVGTTPAELPISPGLHSVRVSGEGDGSYTEMLELRPGATRFVTAQFGLGPRPVLRHDPPGRILVRGPIALSVSVERAGEGPLLRPTLHFPDLDPGAREVPLSKVDGEETYVGLVRPEMLPMGADLSYYFTVLGPGGETVYSDLYVLHPEESWGGGHAPADTAAAIQ